MLLSVSISYSSCSRASRWRQHLARSLQLPRAGASLIALASFPRCQSAVTIQGHREPESGGVCSGRAWMWPWACVCVRARVCVSVCVFSPPMAMRAQESLHIQTGISLKPVDGLHQCGVSSLLFTPQCQSNQKICLLRRKPGSRSPWQRSRPPASSPDALRSPTAKIKAGSLQLPLLFHLWFVCF